MKLFCSLSLCCLIITSSLFSQVKITDYDVPISKAMRTMVNFNYNYYGTKDTTLTNRGTLELDYNNYFSSLPFSWTVFLNASLLYDKNLDVLNPKNKIYSTLNFSSSINKYFSDSSDFFWYADASALKNQYEDYVGSNLGVGLGLGRMIYATAFAKAIRVDEYLYSENLLREHLTKVELIQLGNLIDRQDEFYTKFNERGDVEFFKEIEKLLIGTSKLVKGIFDSHALLRTSDVLNKERFNIRSFGWNGKVGIKYRLSGLNTPQGYTKEIMPSFTFNIGYPINLRTQFDHTTSYKTNFNDYHEVWTISDLTYELTNLIDLNLIYSFYSEKVKFNDAYSSHRLSLGFNFYLENNINIGIDGTVMKIYSPDTIIWVNDYVRQLMTLINFNIGYRIF